MVAAELFQGCTVLEVVLNEVRCPGTEQKSGVSRLMSGRKQEVSATLLQPGHGGNRRHGGGNRRHGQQAFPAAPELKESLMTPRLYPSSAGHPVQESRSPERLQAQHPSREAPASILPSAPHGAYSNEDTPVYWQTLQVMFSPLWRRDG